MVDKMKVEPLSLAKGKRDKIRMAKLPLDLYLDWKQGTKNLTINQVYKLLTCYHILRFIYLKDLKGYLHFKPFIISIHNLSVYN